uniref:Uncharacterized protein n=1 Tax=Anopheles quadriannulatus TaxID=34691 RepID=A0A182XTM7_ANOQN
MRTLFNYVNLLPLITKGSKLHTHVHSIIMNILQNTERVRNIQ